MMIKKLFILSFSLLLGILLSPGVSAADILEAGEVNDLAFPQWKRVYFSQTHSRVPIVLATPSSQNNGDGYPIPRIRNITPQSFEISACVDKGDRNCDTNSVGENFNYFVWDLDQVDASSSIYAGIELVSSNFNKTFNFSTINTAQPSAFFSAQTNNLNNIIAAVYRLENVSTSNSSQSIKVRGCSHQHSYLDVCGPLATSEAMGWVVIYPDFSLSGFTMGQGKSHGNQWLSIHYPSIASPRIMNTIKNVQDKGRISDKFPKYPWVKNITSNSASVRFCESNGSTCNADHEEEIIQRFVYPSTYQKLSVFGPTRFDLSASVSYEDQLIEKTFPSGFGVDDTSGYNWGWYTTISASDFNGSSRNIANADVLFKWGAVAKVSGADNPRVSLAPGMENYQNLSTPKVLLQRERGDNQGIIGSYATIPTIKFTIPAFMPSGEYKMTMTHTLYEYSSVEPF